MKVTLLTLLIALLGLYFEDRNIRELQAAARRLTPKHWNTERQK